jgi:hypothetical protein
LLASGAGYPIRLAGNVPASTFAAWPDVIVVLAEALEVADRG